MLSQTALTGRTTSSLILLITLPACAAKGPLIDLAAEQRIDAPGQGKLILYRPTNALWWGTYPTIALNDEPVGPLRDNGYLSRSLPPGRYSITGSGAWMTMPYPLAPLSVTVEPGQVTYVKFDLFGGSRTQLAACRETQHTITICETRQPVPTLVTIEAEIAQQELPGVRNSE